MIVSLSVAALALLIMYWWASKGAWSAFLHMVCVIVAGALAFALWEPLGYLLLPRGFSGYALGVTLLGLFLAFLLALRLATDRLIPANLQPAKWADMVMGGIFGVVSGVLTMGMVLIGCGFVQSSTDIYDMSGWVRRSDVPKPPAIGSDNAPALMIADATVAFYGYLSWGSFTPWMGGGTLNTHEPELTRTALSLYRDSFNNGTGRVGLPPDSITGIMLLDPGPVTLQPGENVRPEPAYAVQFKADTTAYDGGGQQFVLSASQARLIGAGHNGMATAVHPTAWIQTAESGSREVFYFSAPSTYATSLPPGAGESTFVLFFPKGPLNSQEPKFFQIKGVRYPLQRATQQADAFANLMKSTATPVTEDPEATRLGGSDVDSPNIQYALKMTLNSNDKSGLSLDNENQITGGSGQFPRGAPGTVNVDLRIKGFKVIPGSRLVRVNASAVRSGARLFPEVNEWVRDAGAEAQDARVAVIDDKGVKYFVVGYTEDDGQYFNVKAAGGSGMRLRDIPIQSLGAQKTLTLYFAVPENTKLKFLALDTAKGPRAVNTLDFTVKGGTQ